MLGAGNQSPREIVGVRVLKSRGFLFSGTAGMNVNVWEGGADSPALPGKDSAAI